MDFSCSKLWIGFDISPSYDDVMEKQSQIIYIYWNAQKCLKSLKMLDQGH